MEKRLNLDDPTVWDKWRELYDDLSDQEQLDFANECADRFPGQEHHNFECFRILFSSHVRPGCLVMEVGGWKGELAKKCIDNFDIKSWVNFEFSTRAVYQTVPIKNSYEPLCPPNFRWFLDQGHKPTHLNYDVFVSAHTIEHFSDSDLLSLLNYISNIPIVMLEAPIGEIENDWRGYMGTHKLKMGWLRIDEAMAELGYSSEKITNICRLYKKVK